MYRVVHRCRFCGCSYRFGRNKNHGLLFSHLFKTPVTHSRTSKTVGLYLLPSYRCEGAVCTS